MNDNIFPKPSVAYADVLKITEQLLGELEEENLTPFRDEFKNKNADNYKKYIIKINISVKLTQIKEYITICQTYKKLPYKEQEQALKKVKILISTWKAVTTRKIFGAYQYMLWSMLNLPLVVNEQTENVVQEIMANPYLRKYVQEYDDENKKIIWQNPLSKPKLSLLVRFRNHTR